MSSKDAIIKLIQKNELRYQRTSRKTVLIQLNDYFSKSSWQSAINKYPNVSSKLDFIFTKNKFQFIRCAGYAACIFAFNFNLRFVENNRRLELFYLGQRNVDNNIANLVSEKIKFKNIPPFGKNIIAEYCVFAIFTLGRNLQIAIKNQVRKKWNQKSIINYFADPIIRKKVGIAGLGNVGLYIAEYISNMGFEVYGWDSNPNIFSQKLKETFAESKLVDFLVKLDILIIALPLNERTENLFNYEILSKLKKDSILINIGRGSIVNEDDLLRCIKNKKIGGAVLDVFQTEPLKYKSKFWTEDNIVITPHIAGNINYFVKDIQNDFLKSVEKWIKNE
ncbi:hypothetical protein C4577_00840 [Candidatus Parcubacteria bacterium]|nr:MAG: hypothetical protein C4577_00840 [Candidatus Parcubacteria bacterium]